MSGKDENKSDPNSLYRHAWEVYEKPTAGEPRAEDGYVPDNAKYEPGLFGIMPPMGAVPYKVLNDPVLIKKKQEMRKALKEEFLKQAYNPYRHASAAGGVPFDSNVHRYITMLRTQVQFFQSSPRTTVFGVSLFIGGPLFLYYTLKYFKSKEEAKYRSGKVAYKDREYKFMV